MYWKDAKGTAETSSSMADAACVTVKFDDAPKFTRALKKRLKVEREREGSD